MKRAKPVSRADYEVELVRSICRSVIRRVKDENPSLQGEDLLRRLELATPFRATEADLSKLQAIWHDEIAKAVPDVPMRLVQMIH